jgi:hypothetical protein
MTDSMRQQRTPCAPSPLAGEGWGGGYHSLLRLRFWGAPPSQGEHGGEGRVVWAGAHHSLLRLRFTPLPTAFANASAVDLPRKGGGDSRPPL